MGQQRPGGAVTVRGKSGGGSREKVRVKKSRNRSQSSRQWLERQLNDPYVARAKREGMRSRAAGARSQPSVWTHLNRDG